jgi:hypothetical protein
LFFMVNKMVNIMYFKNRGFHSIFFLNDLVFLIKKNKLSDFGCLYPSFFFSQKDKKVFFDNIMSLFL